VIVGGRNEPSTRQEETTFRNRNHSLANAAHRIMTIHFLQRMDLLFVSDLIAQIGRLARKSAMFFLHTWRETIRHVIDKNSVA